MVATIDLGILVVFLIVFLFAAGIVHPIFWFLCAFVSMFSTSVFNDLYPDTLWSFVFLIFGNTFLSNPVLANESPYFFAISSISASSGPDVTVTLPTGWEPEDIFLVLGVVRDIDDSVTMSGYTPLSSSPIDLGTTARFWAFWRRAVATDGNPLFNKNTATGDTYVQMAVYRGAKLIGVPFVDDGIPVTGSTDPASCSSKGSIVPDTVRVA